MDLIVTVTPTIQDGTVVRWYRSLPQAEDGRPPMVSASRNGVMVDGYLHLVPADVLTQAAEVYETLRTRRDPAEVAALATHRRPGLLKPLKPIAEESL